MCLRWQRVLCSLLGSWSFVHGDFCGARLFCAGCVVVANVSGSGARAVSVVKVVVPKIGRNIDGFEEEGHGDGKR